MLRVLDLLSTAWMSARDARKLTAATNDYPRRSND